MKRTKIDLGDEKKLITNMITSKEFLKKIAPMIDPKLFESKYARIISGWILEFYKHTDDAPGRAIQDVFQKKSKLLRDDDAQEAIGDYLRHLSKSWEEMQINNVEYSYINAVDYLRLRNIDITIEKLQQSRDKQDPSEGESLISKFKRIERPEGSSIDLFKDAKAISDALEHNDEILFTMPGDFGIAMGPVCVGNFITINAPPKRGKSWLMQEFGFRGALAGCDVWIVSLEMDTHQTLRRLWSGFNGKPLKSGKFKFPKFKDLKDGSYDIVYEMRELDGMSSSIADIKKLQNKYTLSCGNARVKISTLPTDEVTLSMLENELDNMEFYENFVPKIIVVDYADILKADGKFEAKRHALDSIWKGLRGMSQKRNRPAIITGSQTGRETSKKDAGVDDVAEHWGKNAHVTQAIFLNQTEDEKEMGIVRAECSLKREGKTMASQVVILQGLEIGRPYLDSKFRKNVNTPNNKEFYGI